jgi:hypothetical protein
MRSRRGMLRPRFDGLGVGWKDLKGQLGAGKDLYVIWTANAPFLLYHRKLISPHIL